MISNHTLKPQTRAKQIGMALFYLPIKRLEILLLPDFEENLHGVSVIVNLGKARQVLLHFIPLSSENFLVEILCIEEEP